jgi:mono/diheme cytochrome c family protein
MSKRTAIGTGLAAAISVAMAAFNGASADAVAGKALAEKWCVECHGGGALDHRAFAARLLANAAREDAEHYLHARPDGRHRRLHIVA